jgi:hypothetical protein
MHHHLTSTSLALGLLLAQYSGHTQAQSASTWTRCSDQFRVCVLPTGGARLVRFGANGNYITKAFTTDLDCNATVFGGDPAPGQAKQCEYGAPLYREIAPQVSNMMGPWVDTKRIPIGNTGSTLPITVAAPLPTEEEGAAFRINCTYSHMNFDDAIVYPNQPGASHLHVYFGNTSIDYSSTTTDSVRLRGNSTCAGGSLNRSAYWVPALVDTRTGTPVAPTSNVVYYKAFGDTSNVQPMPLGLRELAGSMRQSKPEDVDLAKTAWRCKDKTGQIAVPTGVFASIPNCPVGSYLWLVVNLPTCWNGRDLDSPDHRAHMAYAGTCPASHPVRIPNISYHIEYKIEKANDPQYWRLSSDMYSSAQPGGYSMHADWINGWDKPTLDRWIQECIRERRSTNNTTCDGVGLSTSHLKNQQIALPAPTKSAGLPPTAY